MLGCKYNRISNETVSIFLHFGNLGGLVLGAAVMMNHTDSSTQLIDNSYQYKFQHRCKYQLTATEMAISDSVTVSIGEETRGAFNVIFFVSADVRSFMAEKHCYGQIKIKN